MVRDSVIAFRIKDRMKKKVQALAELEGESMSEYILDMLKKKVWEAEQKGILPKDFSIGMDD